MSQIAPENNYQPKKVTPFLSAIATQALYMQGIKVHVEHFRRRQDFSRRRVFSLASIRREGAWDQIDPKGGMTVVTLVDLNRKLQWTAEAHCHEVDHYNKTEGINRAFTTAIRRMSQDLASPEGQTFVHAEVVDVTLLSPQEKEAFIEQSEG